MNVVVNMPLRNVADLSTKTFMKLRTYLLTMDAERMPTKCGVNMQ